MTENTGDISLWVTETYMGSVGLSFKVTKTLFSGRSDFQRVDIVETRDHGRMLLNDGMVMLCERDEFIYHEMIAHVPLFVHPDPKQVLVIGGGDGGTVREILKHRHVEKVVMVEIDEMVVSACREHMPSVSCGLSDHRVDLRIADGVRFVRETDERFDLIIVDSTDPVGPAAPLFNREFYEHTARILNQDGILISQAESPFYNQEIQRAMLANQRPFFKRLHLLLFSNMTYPGGLWSFGFASNGPRPLRDFDPERVFQSRLETRYYNGDVHRASFMLPNFVREGLSGILDEVEA